MKTMTHSLHLAGGIAALLVASTLTSLGITNNVPYSWDFESYSNGVSIADAVGTDGWYGEDGLFVAAETNYPTPGTGYPIDTTHDVYASMTGPVTNQITGGALETVWIDHMVKPERWKQDDHPADLPADTQMAYYVSTNDHLVIHHRGIDTNASSTGSMWSEIDTVTIGSGDWARVSIGMGYFQPDFSWYYFQVKINGELVSHLNGKVDPSVGNWADNGSYFAMAADSISQLNSIVMRGNGLFDDFVVSTNTPEFNITHVIMAQVMSGESGGMIDPEGDVVVDDGSNQLFTVTADTNNFWSIEKVVYVENGMTTTNDMPASPYTKTFTGVTNAGSINVYFVAEATNGVPRWWMAASGLDGQDPADDPDDDGFTTAQEHQASTHPNDDTSYLRISRTWQANGTNYVEWESVNIDEELPPFDMMTSTNLTISNSFSSAGVVVRGGTNTWSEAIPSVGTFYKVSAPAAE